MIGVALLAQTIAIVGGTKSKKNDRGNTYSYE